MRLTFFYELREGFLDRARVEELTIIYCNVYSTETPALSAPSCKNVKEISLFPVNYYDFVKYCRKELGQVGLAYNAAHFKTGKIQLSLSSKIYIIFEKM